MLENITDNEVLQRDIGIQCEFSKFRKYEQGLAIPGRGRADTSSEMS